MLVISVLYQCTVLYFVRPIGSDIAPGEVLLEARTRLGPSELALLSTFPIERLSVHRLPRVGVLSTGSEVHSFIDRVLNRHINLFRFYDAAVLKASTVYSIREVHTPYVLLHTVGTVVLSMSFVKRIMSKVPQENIFPVLYNKIKYCKFICIH